MSSSDRRELTLLIISASVLGVIDSMIPKPLPFFRLGLANIPAVIATIRWGLLKTLELNMVRVLAVGVVTGIIGTPTFILSISGALTSALVMGSLIRIGKLSIVGISVSGAVSSIWVQLFLAGIILHDIPVERTVPLLTLWGVVSGMVVGVLSKTSMRTLHETEVLRRTES